MSYELAQKFADFETPVEIKQMSRAGRQLIGSLGFTKMMLFANETELTNDDIDYYMACPPKRMEDESYDDMKLRTRFANALLKYRAHLYDYSVFPVKDKNKKKK
jgi:hypothetical protein